MWTLGTNLDGILNEIETISFKEMHLKMSSEKCQQYFFDLNLVSYHTNALQHIWINIRWWKYAIATDPKVDCDFD